MKIIDLDKYYPGHKENQHLVYVSDDVEALLQAEIAAEKAYRRKMRYHKVKYIEDIYVQLEQEQALQGSLITEEVEAAEQRRAIFEAFATLTPMQARRAIAYFYEKQTTREIAEKEGVTESSVKSSIKGARIKLIEKLKKLL